MALPNSFSPNRVMPGKYLDSVCQTRRLHRQAKPSGEVVNVDPAPFRQERRLEQDPEVAVVEVDGVPGSGLAVEDIHCSGL